MMLLVFGNSIRLRAYLDHFNRDIVRNPLDLARMPRTFNWNIADLRFRFCNGTLHRNRLCDWNLLCAKVCDRKPFRLGDVSVLDNWDWLDFRQCRSFPLDTRFDFCVRNVLCKCFWRTRFGSTRRCF